MIQGKIWGNTEHIFSKNNVSIHRILAKKGYCCSKHKHDSKYNIFFVEKGKIQIEDWQLDYNLIDKTVLESGQKCSIPPKHYHRLQHLKTQWLMKFTMLNWTKKIYREKIVGKKKNRHEIYINS